MTSLLRAIPTRLYGELDGPTLVTIVADDTREDMQVAVVQQILARKDWVFGRKVFLGLARKTRGVGTNWQASDKLVLDLYTGLKTPQGPVEELLEYLTLNYGKFSRSCLRSMVCGPTTMGQLDELIACTKLSAKCRGELSDLRALVLEYGAGVELKPLTTSKVKTITAAFVPGAYNALKPLFFNMS